MKRPPADLQNEADIKTFKRKLKQYLVERSPYSIEEGICGLMLSCLKLLIVRLSQLKLG